MLLTRAMFAVWMRPVSSRPPEVAGEQDLGKMKCFKMAHIATHANCMHSLVAWCRKPACQKRAVMFGIHTSDMRSVAAEALTPMGRLVLPCRCPGHNLGRVQLLIRGETSPGRQDKKLRLQSSKWERQDFAVKHRPAGRSMAIGVRTAGKAGGEMPSDAIMQPNLGSGQESGCAPRALTVPKRRSSK